MEQLRNQFLCGRVLLTIQQMISGSYILILFCISYNLGPNWTTILHKFWKLGKLGFSIECFRGDFLQFSSATVKTFISGDRLVICFYIELI